MRQLKCTLFSARGKDTFTTIQREMLMSAYSVDFVKAAAHLTDTDFVTICSDSDIIGLTPRAIPTGFSKCLKQLQLLKHIAVPTTGTEWLDTSAIKANNISFSNVPDFSSTACAEFTAGLLLSIVRKIPEAIQSITTTSTIQSFCGFELRGKNIGIIGLGNVGSAFAKICIGFGMNVFGTDICSRSISGVRFCSLDTIAEQCSLISLHIPLTPQSYHFVNDSLLKKFVHKPVLINVARPRLADNEAIRTALQEGLISAYAVDIGYCDKSEFKDLLSTGRVTAVPHISWYTRESVVREIDGWLQNILDFKNKL
jgi:lactate dehydrogenase-like 2-hydroxyacid dehydrogenase